MLENVSSITYRGSLKSCNYSCSYCPFGKKPASDGEIERDKADLEHICSFLESHMGKDAWSPQLNLLIAPYGEAMIHPHYREMLGKLSRKEMIRRVGCQTNLSFPVEEWIQQLKREHADLTKIVLWATFHPEMTLAEVFSEQVKRLADDIDLSVGVVGDPDALLLIKRLRTLLPPQIYLWINQMDGMKRRYTQEEISFFSSVDPMFEWELKRGKRQSCEGGTAHRFLNGRGELFACNRAAERMGNLYAQDGGVLPAACSGRRCDCYLAYSHTEAFMKCRFLSKERLHRVPERVKPDAIFLDVDGTLLDRDGKVGEETVRALQYISEKIPLYLATELPAEIALRKCRRILNLLAGGCFSGGAHCVDWKTDFEEIACLVPAAEKLDLAGTRVYRQGSQIVRILMPAVLAAQHQAFLTEHEIDAVAQTAGMVSLVKQGVDKLSGIGAISRHLGLDVGNVMCVGNGRLDETMMRGCGYGVFAGNSKEMRAAADYCLEVHQLPYVL